MQLLMTTHGTSPPLSPNSAHACAACPSAAQSPITEQHPHQQQHERTLSPQHLHTHFARRYNGAHRRSSSSSPSSLSSPLLTCFLSPLPPPHTCSARIGGPPASPLLLFSSSTSPPPPLLLRLNILRHSSCVPSFKHSRRHAQPSPRTAVTTHSLMKHSRARRAAPLPSLPCGCAHRSGCPRGCLRSHQMRGRAARARRARAPVSSF